MSFKQLYVLANHAVVTYSARDDYSSLRQLLEVALRVHCVAENGQPQMMISMLSRHTFWHNTGVWSGIFYEGFTSMVLRSQMENPGDKTEECQQYAFAELTKLVHAMSAVGLPTSEVTRFLNTMKHSKMLDQSQTEMLADLAEGSQKNGPSSPNSPPALRASVFGLDSMASPNSSNTRYTQDAMRKILATLLEQRLPDSLDELIEWLKFCGDITAVRGFVRQLARFIEERPRHNCEPSSYYILSAMLTRCLTTCEAMRDFGNIRTIMNTSLMLYGPTMDAQADNEDIKAMSRHTSRHAIWQSTAYWISVLRQNCDDATSDLHMNDEDPSEQHYTLLNKVVQLM